MRDKTQQAIAAIEKEFRQAYEAGTKASLGAGDLDDLRYKFYRDSWKKLPNFGLIKHEEEGRLPGNLFDLSPRSRNEAFGFVFNGTLNVPQDGTYTFYLDSDDGARLTVGGKQVLDYDGIHGVGNEKTATVRLARGRLPIQLEYFQNLDDLGLVVAWSGPGFGRRLLSAGAKTTPTDLRSSRQGGAAPSRGRAHGRV